MLSKIEFSDEQVKAFLEKLTQSKSFLLNRVKSIKFLDLLMSYTWREKIKL